MQNFRTMAKTDFLLFLNNARQVLRHLYSFSLSKNGEKTFKELHQHITNQKEDLSDYYKSLKTSLRLSSKFPCLCTIPFHLLTCI